MIRLKQLKLSGFRSFEEEAVITFPESGAILIQGMDTHNGTSSGSGKSSILLAIDFALGNCSLPSTELTNWNSKKLQVELILVDDSGNEIIINRSPKLEITINGEKYKGKSTGAEEELDKFLGLPRQLVKTLVSRAQREGGKFVNFTDVQKKEFLTTALQLGELEDAQDRISSEIKLNQQKLTSAKTELSFAQQSLDECLSDINSLNLRVSDYQSELETPMDISSYISEKAALEQKLKEISSDDLEKLQSNLKLAKDRLGESVAAATAIARLDSEYNSGLKAMESLKKEILTLMESICPTCEREWKSDSQRALLDSKKSQMIQLHQSIKIANRHSRAQLETVAENKSLLSEEVEKLQQSIWDFTSNKTGIALAIKRCDDNIAMANSMKSRLEKEAENRTNMIKAKEAKSLEYKEKIAKKESEISDLESEASVLDVAGRIIGRSGFLGVIFDEILTEIETRSNDLIGHLPNVGTFTLSFSSSGMTQSGNVKNKIDLKVIKNGNPVSLRSLSGGQQAAIELCVDLAVGEVIRRRSGSNLGWTCLDEAMDGLDIEPKAAAIDMIKNKIGGQIVIIDHATEIKESFASIIEVVNDGNSSHVSQIS